MGKFITILSFCFISCTNIIAQNMSEYKWNNRLLIIMTDDITTSDYINQLRELGDNQIGLVERKLIIISATPKKYKEGIDSDSTWQQSESVYKQYKESNSPFEVILIGLDGGIKARETKVFSIESLFTLIDGIPMRRAEIRNK